ncbi:MAG: Hpt domain-containing protein [Pseudomonadota bacterium]|nr:Hpt domain-containing protein [Pseudomonadota bacterium]
MTGHFDEAAFGALKAALGEQMVGMLLGKFLAQMHDKIGKLKVAVDTGDMAEIRQQAHDLTSSSGTVGLGAMRDAASACEYAVKEGRTADALDRARELIALAPDAEAAIRAAYPEL